MKTYFTLSLMLLVFFTSCKTGTEEKKQRHSEKIIAQDEKTILSEKKVGQQSLRDFVPQNYFLLDSALGSLDNDKTQHIALVCAPKLEQNPDTFSEVNRNLILLQKKNNLLTEVARNDQLILCKSCGGVFGDPYNGISLKNNILTISNYGGSAWRWSENYTFRFQNNECLLIGATYDSYFNAKECKDGVGTAGRQLEDINFASGNMQILHTHGTDCTPYEDYWKNFGKKKLIALSDFPGTANQWPSGKIKDGDGKE